MGNQTNLSGNSSDECASEPTRFIHIQIYYVGIFGTILACSGIFENIILLYIFLTRPYFNRASYFYLKILAVLDLLHCVLYIVVMSLAVISEYDIRLLWLNNLWHQYLIPFVVIDYIVLCGAAYILVAASMERYFSTKGAACCACSQKTRSFIVFGILFVALLINLSMYWEMELLHKPHCTHLAEYTIVHGDILKNELYEMVWAFWIRNILNIFLPFFLLIFLNFGFLMQSTTKKLCSSKGTKPTSGRTVSTKLNSYLRKNNNRQNPDIISTPDPESPPNPPPNFTKVAKGTSQWLRRAKTQVKKSTTRTLICIVIEYVLSNGLSVFVAGWEHMSIESLSFYPRFYSLASDTISLLTVLSTVLHLPIYAATDIAVRQELKHLFCRVPLHQQRIERVNSLPSKHNTDQSFSDIVGKLMDKKPSTSKKMNRKANGKISSRSMSFSRTESPLLSPRRTQLQVHAGGGWGQRNGHPLWIPNTQHPMDKIKSHSLHTMLNDEEMRSKASVSSTVSPIYSSIGHSLHSPLLTPPPQHNNNNNNNNQRFPFITSSVIPSSNVDVNKIQNVLKKGWPTRPRPNKFPLGSPSHSEYATPLNHFETAISGSGSANIQRSSTYAPLHAQQQQHQQQRHQHQRSPQSDSQSPVSDTSPSSPNQSQFYSHVSDNQFGPVLSLCRCPNGTIIRVIENRETKETFL